MVDNFKIIIITAERELPDESDKIRLLLDAGADFVHIRKPMSQPRYVDSLLNAIPAHYRKRLKLHDNYDLAVKYGTGIHLNSRNTDVPLSVKNVSRSCHSLNEISQCRTMDYVTLSPVFDSISKSGYKAEKSLLSVNMAAFPINVIALGGVTLSNLDILKRQGFAGAAFLGSVWDTGNGFDSMISYLRQRNSRLQFITDAGSVDETVSQVRDAITGGCRWIQIRMKEFPSEAIRETAVELLPECRETGTTLIMNDDIELAAETELHGVHVGQKDRTPGLARDILGPHAIVGLTVNTLEQLPEALKQPADYFGIGPFRFTTTKKKLAPTLGIEGYIRFIEEMKKMNDFRPFVAIGGIRTDDIYPLISSGVPGIAISGAIAHADNRIEATEKFINEINHHIKSYINE